MFDQAQKLRELVKQSKSNIQVDDLLTGEVQSKIISFVSGKSGIGKTVLLSNLALKLAKLNKKVVILDTDLGVSGVEIVLNMAAKLKFIDIINEEKDLSLQLNFEDGNPIVVNYGAEVIQSHSLNEEQIESLINKFKSLTDIDYILIDTSAGLNKTAIDIAKFSDQVFVVASADASLITESYAVVKILVSRNKNLKLGILVNLVKSRQEALNIFDRINSVATKFLSHQLEFLGFVLSSSVVNQSVNERQPFVLNSASSQPAIALSKLSDMVINSDKKEKLNYFACNV